VNGRHIAWLTARADPPQTGQALVEFSLAIVVFLLLLMGIFDVGRGIYAYNGVSQAVREIARVASVHPGSTLGSSTEITNIVGTQQRLVPGLGAPTFSCVDITGAPIGGTCRKGDWVRVQISAPWAPATPLLGLTGTWNLASTTTMKIEVILQ
jgi:Flp pilus assembly protein TadG